MKQPIRFTDFKNNTSEWLLKRLMHAQFSTKALDAKRFKPSKRRVNITVLPAKNPKCSAVLRFQNCLFVSESETRIGQHFTFSDELHIFRSQQDNIWPGNNISYALALTQKKISLGIFTSDIFSFACTGHQCRPNLCEL